MAVRWARRGRAYKDRLLEPLQPPTTRPVRGRPDADRFPLLTLPLDPDLDRQGLRSIPFRPLDGRATDASNEFGSREAAEPLQLSGQQGIGPVPIQDAVPRRKEYLVTSLAKVGRPSSA